MSTNDEDPTGGGIARMMEIASGYLRDVVDAIAATPESEHDRFEMLQLKCSTALALATLAQTTVALLDVADEEGEDDDEPEEIEGDLVAEFTRVGRGELAQCLATDTDGLACRRALGHNPQHAGTCDGRLRRW